MAFIFSLGLAFYIGAQFQKRNTPILVPEIFQGVQAEFQLLSREDLREYQELKEKRLKYEAANHILARVMQIFVADLGLHTLKQRDCKINTGEVTAPIATEPVHAQTFPQTLPSPGASGQARAEARVDQPVASGKGRYGRWGKGVNGGEFDMEKAKGMVRALFQATVWRVPDVGNESAIAQKIAAGGWSNYNQRARDLLRSREFTRDIVPNRTPQQVINQMHSVYLGRCAFENELNDFMIAVQKSGYDGVLIQIINKARNNNPEQIFSGGFNPKSCSEAND
jgi:hypothetical protein